MSASRSNLPLSDHHFSSHPLLPLSPSHLPSLHPPSPSSIHLLSYAFLHPPPPTTLPFLSHRPHHFIIIINSAGIQGIALLILAPPNDEQPTFPRFPPRRTRSNRPQHCLPRYLIHSLPPSHPLPPSLPSIPTLPSTLPFPSLPNSHLLDTITTILFNFRLTLHPPTPQC